MILKHLNRGNITNLLNFQTQCQIRVTWMYLFTMCFHLDMEEQKCEKHIEQDISSNSNNINISFL